MAQIERIGINMSATNKTPNIGLPLFIGTDKPTWLGDWNNTMSTLDVDIQNNTNVSNNALSIGTVADTKADTANTGVAANTTLINTTITNLGLVNSAIADWVSFNFTNPNVDLFTYYSATAIVNKKLGIISFFASIGLSDTYTIIQPETTIAIIPNNVLPNGYVGTWFDALYLRDNNYVTQCIDSDGAVIPNVFSKTNRIQIERLIANDVKKIFSTGSAQLNYTKSSNLIISKVACGLNYSNSLLASFDEDNERVQSKQFITC